MNKPQIGYRVVFYVGEEVMGIDPVRATYEEAVKDIEKECASTEGINLNTFTHAKIEKIYRRSNVQS